MWMYFDDNYGWSLSVAIALAAGGEINEIDRFCSRLRALAGAGANGTEEAWLEAWSAAGDHLAGMARVDMSERRFRSASRKWLRAAVYYLLAERQVADKCESSLKTYLNGLEAFRNGVELGDRSVEFVELPYGEASLPALFVPADGPSAQAPCVVHFDGLDVCKELIYLMHGEGLPERNLSVLICDHPGVGEARRCRDLMLSHETERPATACVDYLETRSDVDGEAIGIMALSLGGYYAPRAAAFEKRLRCCIVWGAIWDLPACVEHCLAAGTGSVDLYKQFGWVLGIDSRKAIDAELDKFRLEEIAEHIECPILIVHGANDQQAPVWTAQATYDGAVNARHRELKVFTSDEGGAEHCQLDNVTLGTDVMHDWAAQMLGAGDRDSRGQ